MTAVAKIANAPSRWDGIWKTPEARDWREQALSEIYDRIIELIPPDSAVVDIGGGVGALGARIQDEKDCHVTVVDHSPVANTIAFNRGLSVCCFDMEGEYPYPFEAASVVVATEVLEHFTLRTRERIYALAADGGVGLFSIPNNRLGPDEEPEHTRKWTAKQFLDELREHFGANCRVEVMDPYLLGVCGSLAIKDFTLSMCLPVRDEEEDLAQTLASFRGVADQMVVGIDPRTVDRTRQIAEEYADVVFDLVDPTGPAEDGVPEDGVHFAHIRNQCIDRCDGSWIFMTEGHERLKEGQDVLLNLTDVVPEKARVGYVYREGNRQRWAFPWLFQNAPDIRFKRSTHNILDYPKSTYVVKLPQISTLHERGEKKDVVRKDQRKVQNRVTLMRDWLKYGNENSLSYLGAEWREYDRNKAIEWLRFFINKSRRNGARRYHTRLILAKELMNRGGDGDAAEAREVLMGATADDWSRTEHWVWLGDLAFDGGDFEEAVQFFRYAATTIGLPPFTMWWIDLAHYAWIPAQRLAMTYGALGNGPEALHWAQRVVELLPDDQEEALEEARRNADQIEEAIEDARKSRIA